MIGYSDRTWAEDMAPQGCDQSADPAAGMAGATLGVAPKKLLLYPVNSSVWRIFPILLRMAMDMGTTLASFMWVGWMARIPFPKELSTVV